VQFKSITFPINRKVSKTNHFIGIAQVLATERIAFIKPVARQSLLSQESTKS
jgi:hypothetical protein